MPFILSKEQLLYDLYYSFFQAKKHKSDKKIIISFNENINKNLILLRDELYDRVYKPQKCNCFIITHPKKREVFAADFRDRIVHHLYFYYTHELFERTFITDSYSCIKGRGTHYGIHRLEHHIRQESNNWQEKCYILKMDLKGYFMHIKRSLLLNIVNDSIDKMQNHYYSKIEKIKWNDKIDIDFINYLSKVIIMTNPIENYKISCSPKLWKGLADSKSLFKQKDGYGLPIGNLTSQLFSNVFLNLLDNYVKRELKCKHYGRYVDDFFIVNKDKKILHKLIPLIENFAKNILDIEIQKGKTKIISSNQGVEFLGAYIKPHRTYVSNQCVNRIKKQMRKIQYSEHLGNSINSFLGVFSHYSSFKIKQNIFFKKKLFLNKGNFNLSLTKYKLKEKV